MAGDGPSPHGGPVLCTTCRSDWAAGAFTEGCEECGGGALARPCLACGGRCGATWRRSIVDSQDSRVAHWVGSCRLPYEEQDAYRPVMDAPEGTRRPPRREE